MKIYTRKGDLGESSLFSQERVPKNHLRMKAYGTVDELNSVIGGIVAHRPEFDGRLAGQLETIQIELFRVGTQLATTAESEAAAQINPITAESVTRLESQIDDLDGGLPKLESFVLPVGHPSASWAHLARTVCRRAERCVIDLIQSLPEESHGASLAPVLAYLNRLSDYLFVIARTCNFEAGVRDVVVKK